MFNRILFQQICLEEDCTGIDISPVHQVIFGNVVKLTFCICGISGFQLPRCLVVWSYSTFSVNSTLKILDDKSISKGFPEVRMSEKSAEMPVIICGKSEAVTTQSHNFLSLAKNKTYSNKFIERAFIVTRVIIVVSRDRKKTIATSATGCHKKLIAISDASSY